MSKEGKLSLMYPFKWYKITRDEITASRHKIIMMVRPSALPDLRLIAGLEKATFIYSLWSGYLDDGNTKELKWFSDSKHMNWIQIHTSGHADIETLNKLAAKLNPSKIIPIHTFFPDDYQKLFDNVQKLDDGETYDI
jgi:ribonuclease J